MSINNSTLAYLCNDLQNVDDYKIDGNYCYHKEKFLGEIKEELKDKTVNIYFKPVTPVKYITININIQNEN